MLAEAYTLYQRRLREAHALDFDDLIMTTVHLLQAHPDVAENYRRRFRHVLVDEYQDTNHAQYTLVKELVGGTRGVSRPSCAWSATPTSRSTRSAARRSATSWSSSGTSRRADDPAGAELPLDPDHPHRGQRGDRPQHRAQAQAAVERRRAPASRSSGTSPTPSTPRPTGSPGRSTGCADARSARPGDVAVFYRTNAQSRVFEEVFIRVGLPYKVVGGVRFYERKEVRDALAYLRAVANADDTVSLRRILNTPRRGIGDRAEACVEALRQPGPDLVRRGAAPGRARRPGIATRAADAIAEFVALLDGLRELAATAPPGGGAGGGAAPLRVPRRAGGEHRPAGRGPGGEPAGAGQRRPGVHRAGGGLAADGRGAAGAGSRQSPGPAPTTVAGFLEQVALVADADQIPSDDPDHEGVVTLMTLHTAKGLEFPVVFLTGLEDGVFPHLRSLGDSQELEEERRLAYVGITRARQRLYLSRAVTRSAWGQPSATTRRRGSWRSCPRELVRWERTEADRHLVGRRPARWRWRAPAVRPSPAVRQPRSMAQRLGVDGSQLATASELGGTGG